MAILREHGPKDAYDVSTLREPYRIEGKKTMAYELVEQLDGEVPDVVLDPTGGGAGLVGMWKAFDEMEALGWIHAASGRGSCRCKQPVVRQSRRLSTKVRSALRRVCPESGAAWAALGQLRKNGFIRPTDRVIVFNTGTGLKYR